MNPLPPRPRLRASFWFEGDAAKCELVLMNERRELVHRETLSVEPGSGLERVQAGLLSAAARLAHARHFANDAGGAVETAPVSAPPPPLPPTPEQLEQQQDERRRRGEQQSAEANELANQLAEGFAKLEQQQASEAGGSSVELLLEPEPKPQPTAEEVEAERQRRRREGSYVENRSPAPPSEPSSEEP